jgi:hypothetical protein
MTARVRRKRPEPAAPVPGRSHPGRVAGCRPGFGRPWPTRGMAGPGGHAGGHAAVFASYRHRSATGQPGQSGLRALQT